MHGRTFVGPRPPFIISLTYDHLHPCRCQQFAYKNFGCQLVYNIITVKCEPLPKNWWGCDIILVWWTVYISTLQQTTVSVYQHPVSHSQSNCSTCTASCIRLLSAFQCRTRKARRPGIRSHVTYSIGGGRVISESEWAKGQPLWERHNPQLVKGKALDVEAWSL